MKDRYTGVMIMDYELLMNYLTKEHGYTQQDIDSLNFQNTLELIIDLNIELDKKIILL